MAPFQLVDMRTQARKSTLEIIKGSLEAFLPQCKTTWYLVDMHDTISDLVAEQIRKHRARLGMTRDDLAVECAKLGAPQLTTAALVNIETGRKNPETGRRRREVSVDELLVLAYAMAVPPLLLLFPLRDGEQIPTPPYGDEGLHPFAAWRWATGEEPPGYEREDGRARADFSPIGDTGKDRFEAWREIAHPIELFRTLRAKGDEIRKARDEKARRNHFGELAQILDDMIMSGIKVPPYTSDWAAEIRATGVLQHPEALPEVPLPSEGD